MLQTCRTASSLTTYLENRNWDRNVIQVSFREALLDARRDTVTHRALTWGPQAIMFINIRLTLD